MAEQLHPDSGARYLLEREAIDDDGSSARYLASVFTPTERIDRMATLRRDGTVTLAETADALSDKQRKRLLAHARQVARDVDQRRQDGLPPWPQRVLRWRAD